MASLARNSDANAALSRSREGAHGEHEALEAAEVVCCAEAVGEALVEVEEGGQVGAAGGEEGGEVGGEDEALGVEGWAEEGRDDDDVVGGAKGDEGREGGDGGWLDLATGPGALDAEVREGRAEGLEGRDEGEELQLVKKRDLGEGEVGEGRPSGGAAEGMEEVEGGAVVMAGESEVCEEGEGDREVELGRRGVVY